MKAIIKWIAAAVLAIATALALSACGLSASPDGGKSSSAGSVLTVRMLDIGQGDAFLLEKDGHFALIDSGDVDQRPKMKEYLKKYHVSTLDTVIITHPHADHLGGMAAVFETVKVKHLYDDGLPAPTPTYRNYLRLIQEKNVSYETAKKGETIEILPGVSFHVLGPVGKIEKKKGESDFNNNSIVGRLVYGSFSMMFTGDAEKEEESSILKAGGDLKSTILKVGHHGSRTSSSPAFLKAVDPKDAFISCGRGNDYGHPHKITLKKLEEQHISIFRTDLDGTVTVTTDGNSYQIAKEH
jgi:competence protein ComEC